MNPKKLLQKILNNNRNIRFADTIKLVTAYGFELKRIIGSHHIFVHPDLKEIINLQEVDGKVKPYQLNQFLSLIEKYNLQMGGEED
jgi:predicted RNA binding protein YcfA (HicA-like mRNA interferase family)